MTENTERLSAALDGRYRIERRLGEGGMATVYLAEDLKHDRKVAVKVLRPELAAVLGADRFLQEIKTTANLQHPHILPLFDSGEADSFLYYVMPFIDGETLRDKLDRETQLGIDEALKITTEIADALNYAHGEDVIHRDIKPENILLHNGRPMVADFGIALAVSAAGGGRMTETGLSLGTPHYMSPEQATAEKDLTNRSDIYSLGSVLYEMLTGEPPYMGNSAQQIIMKIVTEDAQPVTKLRKSVPPNVTAAVAKSLEKLPADRFESAAKFAEALTTASFTVPNAYPIADRGGTTNANWQRVAFAASALAVVAVLVAVLGWLQPESARPVVRNHVNLWAAGDEAPRGTNSQAPPLPYMAAVAPDGSSIIYVDTIAGSLQLFRKPRDQGFGEPIPGTTGGVAPFFSPDGEWLGYFNSGRLRKMPSRGGGSVTVSSDAGSIGSLGAWLDDDTIVYTDDGFNLRRVSADGGSSEALVSISTLFNRGAGDVAALPGGRGVLFSGCADGGCLQADLYVFDIHADTGWVLVEDAVNGRYLPSGHLFYTAPSGGGYAAPFDLGSLRLTGGAVPVLDDIRPRQIALSLNGTLLYVRGAMSSATRNLVLVDRAGEEQSIHPDWTGQFGHPTLSPDGRTLAISLVDDGAPNIWTRLLDRGPATKMTSGDDAIRPAWSADGSAVMYLSDQGGNQVSMRAANGSGREFTLLDLEEQINEVRAGPDDQWLLLRIEQQLYSMRLDDNTDPARLFDSEFNERTPTTSPDGRWLAYVSDLSGRLEVYVSPFPETRDARWAVSVGGGQEPEWSSDGNELFFKSGGMLMSAQVIPGTEFRNEPPQPLFSVQPYLNSQFRQFYAVTPDGQFLMVRRGNEASGDRALILVENWFEELKVKLGN